MRRHLVRYCLIALAVCAFSLSPAAQAQAPVITSISPTTYVGGDNPIEVYGTGFGTTQESSTITLNGVNEGANSWSSTAIMILPSGGTSGNIVVTVNGVASNPVYLQVTVPIITSVQPSSGPPGTQVNFVGANLEGCTQAAFIGGSGGFAGVAINGTPTQSGFAVTAPSDSGTGTAYAVCSNVQVYGPSFTFTAIPLTDPGLQSPRLEGDVNPIISSENDLFFDGEARFAADFQVVGSPLSFAEQGTINTGGLGPRLNGNSCAMCHSQPAIGGSSPCDRIQNPSNPGTVECASQAENPQYTLSGTSVGNGGIVSGPDPLPSFIKPYGPVLEARFQYLINPVSAQVDTTHPSSLVEDIFTVNSSTCSLSKPNFSVAMAASDIAYRIPTPIFGDGLIENIDDSTLLANLNSNSGNAFGISGTFNHSPDDGTITRFGWKAQIKSLQQFAGTAFNTEMGVTNLLFPNERPNPEDEQEAPAEDQRPSGLPSDCLNMEGLGYPEDHAIDIPPNAIGFNGNAVQTVLSLNNIAIALLDNVSEVANWMRLLPPPPTGTVELDGSPTSSSSSCGSAETSISCGQSLFASAGCGICHSSNPPPANGVTPPPLLFTQASAFSSALSNLPVNPYSDFALHHMGPTLTDNITEGYAGGDQFRTAPLWGLGNRYFLMHDGRETNLINAIQDHAGTGSEASSSVEYYNNNLSATQQQDLLNFLRSL